MPLATGQSLSFYEILGPLGAGGMGEVYRARDTRLERDVAIKVLPEELADDDDRLRRFEREAKTLASLNHPNVAGIHGVDQDGDVWFLALELVPGEDLSEWIARGPLPIDDAIDVCRQIADGLEAAHEAGVVHRDLKPANVRVTPEGVIKILDFGLAKPMRQNAAGERATRAEPDSALMTEEGLVLGTPTYMSPEQARGKPVDRRTDIWALGCVLFECLTGRRLFDGATISDVIAAVLHAEVDLSALPAGTPPGVRGLIARCLVKTARQRMRDVGEARIVLESPGDQTIHVDDAPPTRASSLALRAFGIAATIVIALLALRLWGTETVPVVAQPLTVDLAPPSGMSYALNSAGSAGLLLSPDGDRVVFGAARNGELPQLYVRELASGAERLISGTENAQYPFWSPDGRHLGFFSADKLMRVSVVGGAPRALADGSNGKGGSWSSDGWILYTSDAAGVLELVSEGGGDSRAVTDLAVGPSSYSHRFPHFLPDGRRFLYVARNAAGGESTSPHALVLGSLDGAEPQFVGWVSSQATLAGDQAFYCVGTSLYSSHFDPDAPTLEETRRLLVDEVSVLPAAAFCPFSVTADRLAYHTPIVPPESILVQFDAAGNRLSEVQVPHSSLGMALSPDGKRIVALLIDPITGQGMPWICNLAQMSWTPLAIEEADDFFWISDDELVYVHSDSSSSNRILRFSLSDLDGPEVLYETDVDLSITSVARGGRRIAFERPTVDRSFDVYVLDLDSDEPPRAVASTPNDDVNGLLSPDGLWITYQSYHLGAVHLFLLPATGGGRRQQITTGLGGNGAGWHPDGDRLYVSTRDNILREVRVVADENTISLAESRRLLGVDDEAFRYRSQEPDEHRLLAAYADGFWLMTRAPTPPEGGMGRLVVGR